jgi:hypothetical protein
MIDVQVGGKSQWRTRVQELEERNDEPKFSSSAV